MKKRIEIINGPNLNLLGKRQPQIYGRESFESFFIKLRKEFPQCELSYFQSNHEGFLIDRVHEIGFEHNGIIINPGALAHYSYALADAISSVVSPVIEVHISDIYKREGFRRISVTKASCIQCVSGKGLDGYKIALHEFMEMS